MQIREDRRTRKMQRTAKAAADFRRSLKKMKTPMEYLRFTCPIDQATWVPVLVLLALSILPGSMGCSDVQVTTSREYVKASPLMVAIQEKTPLEGIRTLIVANPDIIQEAENTYKIGPLARALTNQDRPLIDLLIDHGANSNLALHSLSNCYPNSYRRYIGPLESEIGSEQIAGP
jgi:hypothetical protein